MISTLLLADDST